ncbi:MAG: hypothetical protein ABIA59_09495, partial [Candidatus Latescibacterota bacterium]
MKNIPYVHVIAVVLLVAGWGILCLQHVLAAGRLPGLSPFIPLAISIVGAVLILWSSAPRQIRTAFLAVGALSAAAAVALLMGDQDAKRLETKWRASDSTRIYSTLHTVGEKVQQLTIYSDSIGSATKQFLAEQAGEIHEDSLAFMLQTFSHLESQATSMKKSGILPPGTEVGLQLLDQNGRRIAWAGWPQPLLWSDQRLMMRGRELLYTREVSLYRILSHVIPIDALPGDYRWYLVIDTPLEVNYKVNNKYLKSTSLAQSVAASLPVNVSFDYYPPSVRALRATRDKEDSRGSPLPDKPTPLVVSNLTAMQGDKSLGLSGSVIVRSSRDEPLLNIKVHSRPFRHFMDGYVMRFQVFARVSIVLALVILFIVLLKRFPRRLSGPLGVLKIFCTLCFFVAIRYSMLSFQPAPNAGGMSIFDPTIFATPAL